MYVNGVTLLHSQFRLNEEGTPSSYGPGIERDRKKGLIKSKHEENQSEIRVMQSLT